MHESKVIRHICGGHEYRYNVETGEVRNNYGSIIAAVRFEKFIPDNVRSIATISTVKEDGTPTFLGVFANIRDVSAPDMLARWAIGECAAMWPDGIPAR